MYLATRNKYHRSTRRPKMANSTPDGNHTTSQDFFCITRLYGLQQKIFILALNVPMSITAFLGNVLIGAALQRVSSLHPPSKLLLRCLTSTDLGVSLIAQPLFVSFLMSQEHSTTCKYLKTLFYTIAILLEVVSILTLTAIAVDRLLALLLGLRYRQVVTLRRVRLVVFSFWLFSAVNATTFIYYSRFTASSAFIIVLLFTVTSNLCYAKIYLGLRQHQTQVHVQEQAHQGQSLNIARYRKTVCTALWVQIALLACFLPYGIVVAIFAFTGMRSPSFDLIWDVTITMALFNSTLNPFLYCWKIREMRQAVKNTIRQLFC